MGSLVAGLLQFSRGGHQQISSLDVRQEIDNTLKLIDIICAIKRLKFFESLTLTCR